MKVAVFTKGLQEDDRRELLNYARGNWEFAGEYSDPEKLLEGAGKRVIEKRGDSFLVLEEGDFSHVLVFDSDSLPEETIRDLYSVFGIEILNFRKQLEIREERDEEEEIPVSLEDEGDYKRVEPL